MLIQPISKNELLEKNAIHVEYVEDGFDIYEVSYYSGSEKNLVRFLKKCIDKNGAGCSFFDFYYRALKEKSRRALHEFFDQDDEELLNKLDIESKEVYFPLTKRILPLPAKLTAREWFFSSFYFTKYPCLIWGNYGLKYPAFFRDKEIMEEYDQIADACGLDVEYLSKRGYRLKSTKRKR